MHARADPSPLIVDAWGDLLVPESFRIALRSRVVSAMSAQPGDNAKASPREWVDRYLKSLPAYANVILRSRFTEDALEIAVSRGIRQYVLVGAGFDSFALRRPPFGRDVAVYEVDHPATQRLKRQRLSECAIAIPPLTHFVAADLAREDLGSALSRSPFRADEPTFFSWLGVSMYLSRAANLATLRAIATCAAPGSELVFTYIDQAAFDAGSGSARFEALRKAVASVSEPFVSGFHPHTLRDELRAAGLDLVDDLDGRALVKLHDNSGSHGLQSTSASHIAVARKRLTR